MENAVLMKGRAARTAITILCFVTFAIGGVLLSALVFPLLTLTTPTQKARHARARKVIGICFRSLMSTLQRTGCMRLETEGLERLNTAAGALILANHPTYIDVVALISMVPHANCVVKGALWRNPFYWNVVRTAGYINNASPEAVIDACAQALADDQPLILFPEGTRTAQDQPLRFQRGAAHVALQAKASLVPVVITCVPSTLTKSDPWWLAPKEPFTFRIEVRELVPTTYFLPSAEQSAVGARRFTEALQTYFSRELNGHGYT